MEEKHESGLPHHHVWIKASKQFRLRDPRVLDIRGKHPNIQKVKCTQAVVRYIAKDDQDLLTNLSASELDELLHEPQAKESKTKSLDTWIRAREAAKDPTRGLTEAIGILEADPKAARDLTMNPGIMNNLKALHRKPMLIKHGLEEFNLTVEWDRTKLLILQGPTNMGKTSLAKALLPKSLMVRHIDLLRQYDPTTHHGVILDDMAFNVEGKGKWFREAQIHLCDTAEDTHIHARYNPAILPAGTPRIITTNRQGM